MTETQPKVKKPWDETLRTLITALLLAMVFRSFAFEPFHIPSGSMKSTLLVGDYIFVSKYAYGYSRYSFPFGLPIFHGRKLEGEGPKRGDVIVFREPPHPQVDFIKRLIGLPGDKIQVKQGLLYINGKQVPREKDGIFRDDEYPNNIKSIEHFTETLPEGKKIGILKERHYNVQPIDDSHTADDTPEFEVPPDHYFMMGDNRDNSSDSRFMNVVGFVPAENLVGRAEIIFFSTDGSATWYNPVSWLTSLRYDRFLKRVP